MNQFKFLKTAMILAVFLGFHLGSNAQQYHTQKSYDIAFASESSRAIAKTDNGEYIAVAATVNLMDLLPDISFIRLDSCLDTVSSDHHEVVDHVFPHDFIIPHDIRNLGGNKFLVTGTMTIGANTPDSSGFALFYDENTGNVTNFARYEHTDIVRAGVKVDGGDGYILCGRANFDEGVVFRVANDLSYDVLLPNQWTNIYYHNSDKFGDFYDIIYTKEGKYALCGDITENGDEDVLAVLVRDDGNTVWKKHIHDTGYLGHDYPKSGRGIVYANDTVFICGQLKQVNGGTGAAMVTDVFVIALGHASGGYKTAAIFDLGTPTLAQEAGLDIMLGNNGELFVAGTTVYDQGGIVSSDGFIMETDRTFSYADAKVFGSAGSEGLAKMVEGQNNSHVMIGTQDDKVFAVEAFNGSLISCNNEILSDLPRTVFGFFPMYVPIEAGHDLDDYPVASVRTEYNVDMNVDCNGCTDCTPVGAQNTYYNQIDTALAPRLHRFVNEGDFDQEFVFTRTLDAGDGGDVIVFNMKPDGVVDWSSQFGTTGEDISYGTRRTSDGGYIVVGTTTGTSNSQKDPFLLKLNSAGGYQWAKVYSGATGVGSAKVIETSDNGFVVATVNNVWPNGTGNHWPIVFKTDADGDIQEYEILKDVGGRNWDHFLDLLETSDGDIVFVGRGGHSSGFDYNPGLVMKLSADLQSVRYERHYRYELPGGSYDLNDPSERSQLKLHAAVEVDGDLYLTGVITNDGEDNKASTFREIVVLKVDKLTGNYISHEVFSTSLNTNRFHAYDITNDAANGNLIIGGNVTVNGDQRMMTLVMDYNLNLSSAYYYGNGTNNMITYLHVGSGGMLLASGITRVNGEWNAVYMRLNADGSADVSSNVCFTDFENTISNPARDIDFPLVEYNFTPSLPESSIPFTEQPVCPRVLNCDGSEVLVSKRASSLAAQGEEVMQGVSMYPNPTSGQVTLEFVTAESGLVNISLYSLMTGERLETMLPDVAVEAGNHNYAFDVNALASGPYLVRVSGAGLNETLKLIVTK